MNKIVLLTLIGALAFVTEGCTFFSKFADSRKELEQEVKPIPVKIDTAQAKPEKEEEAFGDIEEEVEPLPEITGLIPATNPDSRVRSSVRGRNDPFSVVTLNPRIQIEEREERNNPTASRNSNRNTNPTQNNQPNKANRNSNPTQNLPQPPAEVFEPTLAREVVVSGLFQADGRTRIIVQAPEESSSRYVEVGQYLSNGQILVKRIDANSFPSPTVILEQSGTEVAKTIGDNLSEDTVSSLPSAPSSNLGAAVSLK